MGADAVSRLHFSHGRAQEGLRCWTAGSWHSFRRSCMPRPCGLSRVSRQLTAPKRTDLAGRRGLAVPPKKSSIQSVGHALVWCVLMVVRDGARSLGLVQLACEAMYWNVSASWLRKHAHTPKTDEAHFGAIPCVPAREGSLLRWHDTLLLV